MGEHSWPMVTKEIASMLLRFIRKCGSPYERDGNNDQHLIPDNAARKKRQ